jgi:predicted metal-dependent phosphoesterase TrpH
MPRVIFHIHTSHSPDSNLSPGKLVNICLKNAINFIVITDHNTMSGYEEVQKIIREKSLPLKVIPGEEIATREGEIIGIFLKKSIPAGLTLEKTIGEIKKQNGIVCVPHPFDSIRRERIRDKNLITGFLAQIDLIEIFNSRNLKKKDNKKAAVFAEKNSKIPIWGPDAHFHYEVLKCVFEIPDFEWSSRDFLEKMKKAVIIQKQRSFRGFFHSVLKKYLPFSVF